MVKFTVEDPLYQNILAAFGTVIYVKAVISLCDYCVAHKIIVSRISRKCVHMAAGAWIVWWPLFDTSHWTWRLNILTPAVYSIQLFIKGYIVQDPNDVDVQTMTRHGDPKELLNGPFCFTLIMNAVGLFLFRKRIGVVIMSCLGFGDGVAPIIGYYVPFGSYPTFPFGTHDRKTLSGSLGFVMASVMGFYLMRFVILPADTMIPNHEASIDDFSMIVQVATVAAITEGICGPYDNPGIALSTAWTYQYLTS